MKKRQEEEAAAAKKHQEEEAAKGGVAGVKLVSPAVTIVGSSFSVSRAGAFVVKIKCPTGETSCSGKITLRSAHAVVAGTGKHGAKAKAAILTLASGSFTVAGGETKTLTLHLSAAARDLLGRLHALSAKATIVAHNPAGGSHTGQSSLTLRLNRPAHGKG